MDIMDDNTFLDAIHEARLLGLFKNICDKNQATQDKSKMRNILSHSSEPLKTIDSLVLRECGEKLTIQECKRMYRLIRAFLDKSDYRKPIDELVRDGLLKKQKCKCAICGCKICKNDPVDHIVPFKYVGDELKDNFQMLCVSCNSKKNASLDYQIKVLFKLV